MADRRMAWLATVGTLLVLAGGCFTVVTLRGDDHPATQASTPPPIRTTKFVSEAGGFAVRVPKGLTSTRVGRTARFTSGNRHLVVTAGPAGAGQLRPASAELLRRLHATYVGVTVLGHRREKVDGRRALTTYGLAKNEGKVPLRFVLLLVAARPHNYALTVFALAGSDPQRMLPVVDELAGSFHVLTKKHPDK